MANRGGVKKKRPTRAGRPKGSRNKVPQAIRDKIIASGDLTPLDFLLHEMRAPEPKRLDGETMVMYSVRYRLWSEQRLEAAKAAAPYVHPRLATLETTGKGGGPIEHHLTVEFVE